MNNEGSEYQTSIYGEPFENHVNLYPVLKCPSHLITKKGLAFEWLPFLVAILLPFKIQTRRQMINF
jgi:hypothetical protein